MEDYKARMREEYNELVGKTQKLRRILVKHDGGTLDFTPTCPIDLLKQQYEVMSQYLYILEIRAEMEGVEL